MMFTKAEYLRKIEEVRKYAKAYYVDNFSMVTNYVYDAAIRDLSIYEKRYPQNISQESPTQHGGKLPPDQYLTSKHNSKMYNISNIETNQELLNWLTKKENLDKQLHCSLNYDGVSVNIYYHKGELVNVLLKGNGTRGMPITDNALSIKNIFKKLDKDFTGEVRGSIVIKTKDFLEYNKDGLSKKESTPSGLVNSIILNSDPKSIKEKKLLFIPYDVIQEKEKYVFTKHTEVINYLRVIGFKLLPKCYVFNKISDIDKFYKKYDNDNTNDKLTYPSKGILIRHNSLHLAKNIGVTETSVKYAKTYSFGDKYVTSKFLDIEYVMGNNGVITPVGVIEPITISGTEINRVCLHSFSNIVSMCLKKYDNIKIMKNNGLMPKVVNVLYNKRIGDEEPIDLPCRCPSCNSVLEYDNKLVKCGNKDCKERTIVNIVNYTSKRNVDIKGLTYGLIKTLVDKGILKNILDIYKLKQEIIIKETDVSLKIASSIITSIEYAKMKPLPLHLSSLGITGLTRLSAKLIIRYNPKTFYKPECLDTIGTPGVHNIVMKRYQDYLSKNKDFILELIKLINVKDTK